MVMGNRPDNFGLPPLNFSAGIPAPWEADAIRIGTAASNQCAHAGEAPPSVAFCIAGAARSFATPLVQTYMRYNLVGPTAGDKSASRIFLHLKLRDSQKFVRTSGQAFKPIKEANLPSILTTMELPWVAPMIGEAVILNGSGSVETSTVGCVRPSMDCLFQPRADRWLDFRHRQCLALNASLTALNETARNATRDALYASQGKPTCCAPHNRWIADGNNEERLILQHTAIGWCGEAIPRYERGRGRQFDMVVFTRPDAVWWNPVTPWCRWNWRQEMISCDAPTCDMAWFAPRRHLEHLTRQHEMHRDCPKRANPLDKRTTCCSTSEHLLGFARVRYNATHALDVEDRPKLSNVSGNVLLKGMNVLRKTRYACIIVLSHSLDVHLGQLPSVQAGRYAFSAQQKQGLLVATLSKLRALFIRNESGLGRSKVEEVMRVEYWHCRRALGFYGQDSIA